MWKHLSINDNHYYFYMERNCESISAIFSDLTYFWKESLLLSDALSRFVEINPEVKVVEDSLFQFIQLLFDEEKSEKALENTGEIVNFSIKTPVEPTMKYFFEFSKQPQEAVYREITLPLILLVNELNYRQELLFKQLEEKDVELLEYKLEGFKITRKNVITEKFNKDDFNKSVVQECIELRLKNGINKVSETFVKGLIDWYPLYKRTVLPYDTEQLKQGNISVEKSLEQVKNDVKQSPKRKHVMEPNVPIKRPKTSKKKIL